MSNHEGVTCDNCLTTAFTGQRFKCLICFDYDLCHECFMAGAFSTNHLPSHSMQCILTRKQLEVLLAGESNGLTMQSFQCPFCTDLGFNIHLLETHVRNKHKDKVSVEVMCPICSVSLNREPNRLIRDLPQHIINAHKKPVLDMYEEEIGLGAGGLRQIRRVNNASRGGAMNSQRMRTNLQTMTFNEQNKESLSELLSQLSVTRGVRTQSANVTGISTHLQHLESQLTTTRQHLERLRTLNVDLSMREAIFSQLPAPSSKPPKIALYNGVIVNESGGSLSSGMSEVAKIPTDTTLSNTTSNHHTSKTTHARTTGDSDRFLLRNYNFNTDDGKKSVEVDDEETGILKSKRSLFAHELTMLVMALQTSSSPIVHVSSASSSSLQAFSTDSLTTPSFINNAFLQSQSTQHHQISTPQHHVATPHHQTPTSHHLTPTTHYNISKPHYNISTPHNSIHSTHHTHTSSINHPSNSVFADNINADDKAETKTTSISTSAETSSTATAHNSITSTRPITSATKSVNFTNSVLTNAQRSVNITSTATISTTNLTSFPVSITTTTTPTTTMFSMPTLLTITSTTPTTTSATNISVVTTTVTIETSTSVHDLENSSSNNNTNINNNNINNNINNTNINNNINSNNNNITS